MTKKAYQQHNDMFMKLTMARASSQHAWITNNNHGNIEQHVNILPGTFYRKSRARKWHARVLHNCKKRHGWLEHNHMFKTSLLKYLKICLDLSVATCLHGIKITAEQGLKTATSRSLVCMLVLVTTQITKMHVKHLYKEDMAQFKTHVELILLRCTHQMQQK